MQAFDEVDEFNEAHGIRSMAGCGEYDKFTVSRAIASFRELKITKSHPILRTSRFPWLYTSSIM